MSINKVLISGNLTRDPEQRMTQSGMAIMTFGVAVNDRRRNPQTGEWEDYANFVDCTMFGNRAASIMQGGYLSKGSKVAIEGKLRWSQWEKDGQKRSKLEVIVDEIEFMSRQGAQNGSNGQYQPQPNSYTPQGGNGAYNAPQPAQGGYQQQPMQGNPQQGQQMTGQQQMAVSVYDDIPF